MTHAPLERLRLRASQLARRPPEVTQERASMVLFIRGGQVYGVTLEEVEGAGKLREVSPIPDAAPWMFGALQYKGEVLTLIDLLTFWGTPVFGLADLPTFVTLTNGRQRVGVMVEELLGAQEVDGAATRYEGVERVGLLNVARLRGEPVLVLSARNLLSDPRFQP
jgi:purine-binding chemotaxis protein CheW